MASEDGGIPNWKKWKTIWTDCWNVFLEHNSYKWLHTYIYPIFWSCSFLFLNFSFSRIWYHTGHELLQRNLLPCCLLMQVLICCKNRIINAIEVFRHPLFFVLHHCLFSWSVLPILRSISMGGSVFESTSACWWPMLCCGVSSTCVVFASSDQRSHVFRYRAISARGYGSTCYGSARYGSFYKWAGRLA